MSKSSASLVRRLCWRRGDLVISLHGARDLLAAARRSQDRVDAGEARTSIGLFFASGWLTARRKDWGRAGEQIGFGAQALQKIIPEAVTSTSTGYLQVNNDPIIWTMLNAIKEQQKEIEQLKGQIQKLRAGSHRRR